MLMSICFDVRYTISCKIESGVLMAQIGTSSDQLATGVDHR